MTIKFVTLPESNCSPGKQSWSDVANLLRTKIQSEFGDKVIFKQVEFMSTDWFNDSEILKLSESYEIKFPLILINDEIFSNGEKINISQIIKKIKEGF